MCFIVFRQKTAYEMRISDWSSDVCSSDLRVGSGPAPQQKGYSALVKLNKIYTRKGDDGTTGLVDGSRLAKSDARMAVIGDVDETNSEIGASIVASGDAGTTRLAGLTRIQRDLFTP